MHCVAQVLLLTCSSSQRIRPGTKCGVYKNPCWGICCARPVLCCACNSQWWCQFHSNSGASPLTPSQTMFDITESDVFYQYIVALLIALWSWLLSLLQGLAERPSCLQASWWYTHCRDTYLGKQTFTWSGKTCWEHFSVRSCLELQATYSSSSWHATLQGLYFTSKSAMVKKWFHKTLGRNSCNRDSAWV
jgi:hypothetical protein